jgi:rod shape-determining protein MreC
MKKVNIILAILVAVVALLLTTLSGSMMRDLQGMFLGWVSPVAKTGSVVQEGLGAMGQGLKTLDQLEADNRRLITENMELRAANQIFRDLEAENNRLRSALDYRERSLFRLVAARVISRDASTWWNTIKINRGFEDGVEAECTVITDTGIVGKTTTVSKNEAIVLLITDENCKIGAYVEGSREKGIVNGLRVQNAQDPELHMNFLSKSANLQPGQKIYSQGVGAVFPSGLLVGTVKSFRQRELDGQAVLTPAVDFSTLSDAFVIVGEK